MMALQREAAVHIQSDEEDLKDFKLILVQCHLVTKGLYISYLLLRVERTIKNEDSIVLQEALEPHYIHEVGGERLTTTTIRNRHSVDTLALLSGSVHC